jgi:outer membrane protein OmpA-like peptidoglycan-associated protein
VEQNSQRLSGQIDELAAVSNAAKGGARAAQETADAAVVGVNATNERISALDDYEPQTSSSIIFRRGSAVLSRDAKSQLDQVAQQALTAKGYVLEVSGFASAEGGKDQNRRLSQQRADNVIRYLVENHNIPLRRIITPYGYGELQPAADNTTRQGRAENRRVEVKILVNRGLTQGAPQVSSSGTTNPE